MFSEHQQRGGSVGSEVWWVSGRKQSCVPHRGGPRIHNSRNKAHDSQAAEVQSPSQTHSQREASLLGRISSKYALASPDRARVCSSSWKELHPGPGWRVAQLERQESRNQSCSPALTRPGCAVLAVIMRPHQARWKGCCGVMSAVQQDGR